MIAFAPFPIPVVTPKGEGYVVYVETCPMWENDCVTVAMSDGGQWLHFQSKNIRTYNNATYGIIKKKENETGTDNK